MRHLFIASSLAAVLATATPTPAAAERLPFEYLMADASGRRPSLFEWTPDGRRLTYLWDEKGDGKDAAFWILDPATGKSEVLARLADLKDEGKEIAPGGFSWSPGGDALLSTREIIQVFSVVGGLLVAHWSLRDTSLEAVVARTPRWLIVSIWTLMLCAVILTQGSGNAFIYFQF